MRQHLAPDQGQIERFVSSLFRYCDEGTFISLRAFDQHDDKAPPVFIESVSARDQPRVIKRAIIGATRAANGDRAAVFAPPVATFSTPDKARTQDLANGPALSVEIDEGNTTAISAKLEQLLGPATVVMASGSVWTDPATGAVFDKLHMHWRLSEPTRTTAEHEALRDARWLAAVWVGADKTAAPPVHPLRWPGSWNMKGKPRQATIVAENPDAEIHLADAHALLQDAVEAAGLAADKSNGPRESSAPQAALPRLTSALMAIPNHDAAWEEWNRIGMAMWRASGGSADGLKAWADWSATSKKHEEQACVDRWAHYSSSPPTRLGAGTIFHLARRAGWQDARPDDSTEPEGFYCAPPRDDDQPKPPPRAKAAPHVLTPSQCSAEPPRGYIIKGLLAPRDHGALIGPPGSAKSALAPYIGYCVALGLDVFGHRTRPGPVLYLAAEDGDGMKARVAALRARLGDAPNFLLQPVPVDFLTQGSPSIGQIEALIAQHAPVLIVLDTIARAFPGLQENESDQMGHVVKVARQFTQVCDSAVLSLHHPPKATGSDTPRGHGVLNGDLDVTLSLEGQRGETRTVKLGKNRNGPSDLTFSFNVAVHDFGPDEEGDPITAPIAEPVESDPYATAAAARERRLSARPAVVLRELRDLIAVAGEAVCPGQDFPRVRAVSRQTLRQRLIDRAWFADDLLCPALEGGQKLKRSGYSQENTALNTLKNNRLAHFTREWIWT